MIKCFSIVDFAKELGIRRNTFKKYYLENIPPQRKKGNRLYWTHKTVEPTVQQVQNGKLVENTQ